jgi:hypothetical protein
VRLARLALAWLALTATGRAIDTTEVNLAETMPPDGNVTIHRVGNEMVFSDLVAGTHRLVDLWGGPGGMLSWGGIGGTLGNQLDLKAALDARVTAPAAGVPADGIVLYDGASGHLVHSSPGFVCSVPLASLRAGNAQNEASGYYAIALGYYARATGTAAVALGYTVSALAPRAIALGYGATASAEAALAIGRDTQAAGAGSMALGRAVTVTGADSVAIGLSAESATVSQDSTFAVLGGRVGLGVAAPTAQLDVGGDARVRGGLTVEGTLLGDGSQLTGIAMSESDPTFVASPAARIDNQQMSCWDEAYSWGNHAEAHYLTEGARTARWWPVASSCYAATPISTSRIAVSDITDLTTGTPVAYTFGGTTYYGMIGNVLTTAIEIMGPALDTTSPVTSLCAGWPEQLVQADYFIAGLYGDGANETLLASDEHTHARWALGEAYCVGFSAIHRIDDGTAQPKVNLRIGGMKLSTSDGCNGLQVSTSWQNNASSAIAPGAYRLRRGTSIDVECAVAGAAGNAQDLTVTAIFVVK